MLASVYVPGGDFSVERIKGGEDPGQYSVCFNNNLTSNPLGFQTAFNPLPRVYLAGEHRLINP